MLPEPPEYPLVTTQLGNELVLGLIHTEQVHVDTAYVAPEALDR